MMCIRGPFGYSAQDILILLAMPPSKKPAAYKRPAACKKAASNKKPAASKKPVVSNKTSEAIFPMPGEPIPLQWTGYLPEPLSDTEEPSEHAVEHAPTGFLEYWDRMTRNQQLWVWNEARNNDGEVDGIFPSWRPTMAIMKKVTVLLYVLLILRILVFIAFVVECMYVRMYVNMW